MFTEEKETVFILGAGASWHYGYPTGERLVEKVIEKAELAMAYFVGSELEFDLPNYVRKLSSARNPAENWRLAQKTCEAIAFRLKEVNPLLIDYFLESNCDLQEIGKLLIAWVILECEAIHFKHPNVNRPGNESNVVSSRADDWYRFVVHQLMTGCASADSLVDNRVTFVTFNYDISLENAIHQRLSLTKFFADKPDCIKKFFRNERFLHVYGSVPNRLSPNDPVSKALIASCENDHPERLDARTQATRVRFDNILNAAYAASQSLLTIERTDKHDNVDILATAIRAIAQAKIIYILGYGFSEENSKRLKLHESLRLRALPLNKQKAIYFTNRDNHNRINKRASRLIFGTEHMFFPETGNEIHYLDNGSYVEKSTRDVYGALSVDFDALD